MSTLRKRLDAEKNDTAAWLEKTLQAHKEITVPEFAEGIGVTYSKFQKWISGERKMSAYEKDEVTRFAERGVCYKGFKRVKDENFSELLHNLLKEFGTEITQDELAEKIDKDQKTISVYQNRKIAPHVHVKTQYNILDVFYGLCFTDNGECLDSHKKTMYELIELGINGEDCDIDDLASVIKTSSVRETEKFSEYSCAIQCILLEHFKAFFYDYSDVEDKIACISGFRKLSADGQTTFILKLKKSIPDENYKQCGDIELGECEDELHRDFFFDMITEYRNIIRLLRENPNMVKRAQKNKRESTKRLARNRVQFERLVSSVKDEAECFTRGNYDSEITFRAVDFKLTLSYLEWYVWLLLLLSELNKDEIFEMLACSQ